MTISALSAARTLCHLRGWQVSNLELQKLLYIAHMFSLGRSNGNNPLVDETFQAWDYGPVLPSIYRRARAFGANVVRDVFPAHIALHGSHEYQILHEASENLRGWSPGQLVAYTHRPQGAWSNHYRPNVNGIEIPDGSILREYRDFIANA